MHTLLHPLACAFLGGRAWNAPPAKCMGQLSTRMHGKLLTHREPALDTSGSHPVQPKYKHQPLPWTHGFCGQEVGFCLVEYQPNSRYFIKMGGMKG